nr:PREDICTED: P2Y purinoceptor 14-like [Pundamilia nyererei]
MPTETAQNDSKCQSFTYNPNVIPALYYLMFPLALLLNGVAAWVSLHLKSTTTFVVYLKNLIAADTLITLIVPFKIASDFLVIVVCYICITNKVIESFRNSGSNNNHGKQKIKLRVFLVIIVFFVAFGPYHIVRIPYTFQQVNYASNSCLFELSKFAKDASLWLATTNTCIDPLLYVFLCREFKDKLVSLMGGVAISLKLASAPDKPDTTLQQTKF